MISDESIALGRGHDITSSKKIIPKCILILKVLLLNLKFLGLSIWGIFEFSVFVVLLIIGILNFKENFLTEVSFF